MIPAMPHIAGDSASRLGESNPDGSRACACRSIEPATRARQLVNALPSWLLIVTDRHQARYPLDEIVARALRAGARWIWLRDRDLPHTKRRALALRLATIVHGAGGRLSIGDDIALAQEAGTGAAHMRDITGVGQARATLGTPALIGMSAHSVADVAAAKSAGA